MTDKPSIRIGTRESELAVWQATWVQNLLKKNGLEGELIFIKSEGDEDLKTPLYKMGVQGIFTKTLDIALLNNKIDIAVHSMKDVPTQMAEGIVQAAVLPRASYKDILVFKGNDDFLFSDINPAIIATSSIRRKAQWSHRFPHHTFSNLRGNVNTRLKKTEEGNIHGAIFARAGLERIHLLPDHFIELDWMLPAPAQGAVVVVCRDGEAELKENLGRLNHKPTDICTKVERDFLKTLQGGCSTPISALAKINDKTLNFKGNVFSVDGKEKLEIEKEVILSDALETGVKCAHEILRMGGDKILQSIEHEKL